jgi:hypothetical protein
MPGSLLILVSISGTGGWREVTAAVNEGLAMDFGIL